MTKDELLDRVVVQRHRLLVTLEELGDAEWDHPSLCAGWRVREVVGHLVAILDTSFPRALVGIVLAGGPDRSFDKVARRYGRRAPAELLAGYRSRAEARFAPPGLGPLAPLTDVLVHTRDIEQPLGLPAALGPEGLRASLDWCASGRARGFLPASRPAGLRFEATDLDWSAGAGPLVRGPGDAILLALNGRRAGLAELSGDGAATLAGRVP